MSGGAPDGDVTNPDVAGEGPVGEGDAGGDDAARLVRFSYQSGMSDWGARRLESEEFREFVRGELERVAVGDAVELQYDVGCCGGIIARLQVEDVEAGETLGPETTVELERREGPLQGL